MNLTTLETVFNRVDAMAANHVDHFVDVSNLEFENLQTVRIGGNAHPLRTIAQRSIAWRLGIPFNYLAKCPPEIQALNMNYWIEHEKNEQLFFRFDGREVRAVFTTKYKPINQIDLVMELYAMGYRPETQVQCHLDDSFMSLSIMDGERTFDVNGDRFRPGVSISNSEVGLSSLSISAFLLRLVCTNGMVSKTELSASYRHVSTKILTEFPQILEKVSVELGQQRRQIGLSMESPVDDPLATIDSFNRQFQLGEKEREAVAWSWPQEAGETMFAVVNTYTRASQYEGLPAESSWKLQRVGGNVLWMLT
jgi:hypothetical protein